jgi:hypothetical protein
MRGMFIYVAIPLAPVCNSYREERTHCTREFEKRIAVAIGFIATNGKATVNLRKPGVISATRS